MVPRTIARDGRAVPLCRVASYTLQNIAVDIPASGMQIEPIEPKGQVVSERFLHS